MTEKLYYQDADKSQFEALVIDTVKDKKGWKIVLDQTCFFPEGGGQPADKGSIDNIPVLDVQKEDNVIYHYLPEKPGSDTVQGKIDMEWRGDFMQQHTGQHIISGALWQVGKYKTVSVHMGGDYTTIEIDAPEIPEEDLLETETLANRTINNNLPVRFIHTDHENTAKFPLRKPCTRQGKVRLVMIGNFDCVACGGLHFDTTGPVGLVKSIGVEKIRGNARISWKIGQRAFNDYRKKDAVIYRLKSLLSTNEDALPQKTMELQEEITTHKKKCSRLENRLVDLTAQNLYENR
jgi:alanyl-tRNA synthetase